jgi:hypothetical protein
VVEIWAEAALRLGEQDLRRMARLVGAQDRRAAAGAPPGTAPGMPPGSRIAAGVN